MGKTTSKARAMDGSELLQVKPGHVLSWPACAGSGLRGYGGTVMRRDDPLAEPFFFMLEGAPAGAKVSSHDCALADKEYRRLGYEHAPPFEPTVAEPKPTTKPAEAPPKAASQAPPVTKPAETPATDAGASD